MFELPLFNVNHKLTSALQNITICEAFHAIATQSTKADIMTVNGRGEIVFPAHEIKCESGHSLVIIFETFWQWNKSKGWGNNFRNFWAFFFPELKNLID